ncbi:MAG: hypothetical protein OXT74_13845, partial [Candidatus Poribacteria bacterium]|nr:hypothetical protein [Candidatus Poribacteria bacterium]
MNHKQKLGYMAIGAGVLALGIIIGQFVAPDIEAQSNGVFDKITCRELEVVDKTGKRIAFLGRGVGQDIEGNGLEIFDKDGKPAITLVADNVINEVIIHDNDGDKGIQLFTSGCVSSIQVFEGRDKGFDLWISDTHRSMT